MHLKKEHVTFGAEALLAYVSSAVASKKVEANYLKQLISKVAVVLSEIETQKMDPDEGATRLNKLIEALNQSLPKFPKSASYPKINLASEKGQIATQIIGFEHTIQNLALSNQLDFELESVLFNDAIDLWKNVMGGFVTPKQSLTSFSHLINKVNKKLPEGVAYPHP